MTKEINITIMNDTNKLIKKIRKILLLCGNPNHTDDTIINVALHDSFEKLKKEIKENKTE